MRIGARVGIDVGTVRVGIARSDRDGLLAVPVDTFERNDSCAARIGELVNEIDAIEVYVGLPLSLSGSHSASTSDALSFARDIAAHISANVRMVDERLTTVSAHAALKQSGKQASRSRSVVDQVAAVMLLQHALDTERARETAPGTSVADFN